MFFEERFDLLFRRDPSRASVLEPLLDSGKLFRRRKWRKKKTLELLQPWELR